MNGFSASTRTPTSIELRQTAFTEAVQRSNSPTNTGVMKVIRSIPAVTTRRPECLIAARPPASSTSRITVPPWMKPPELASPIDIQRTSIELESEIRRDSPSPDPASGRGRSGGWIASVIHSP